MHYFRMIQSNIPVTEKLFLMTKNYLELLSSNIKVQTILIIPQLIFPAYKSQTLILK